jgi:hypothetical protein
MIPGYPRYYDMLGAWLSAEVGLDALPYRWQVILREVLDREDRELGLFSDRLTYLHSEINARRANIRRFLMEGQPTAPAMTTGQLRELAADRARAAASRPATNSPNGRYRQPTLLNEVVEELLCTSNGVPPGLTEVNRALRAAGQPRATQAEILRAVERQATTGGLTTLGTANGAGRVRAAEAGASETRSQFSVRNSELQ